jgi:Carbohydrate-binding module 48 (Isoamylase N-terminal domain)
MSHSDRSEDSDLSAKQDAELRRLGASLRVRSPLIGAEVDGRIMARVRRTLRARLFALRAWWLRPRLLRISPLGGLLGTGALAALLLIAIGQRPLDRFTGAPAVVAPAQAAPTSRAIQFVLAAPGASRVSLVGDFNGWDSTATPLRPVGAAGVWSVEVPVPPGRHEYAFVIDGREWRPDPTAPRALSNEYGPPNSVITVGAHRL